MREALRRQLPKTQFYSPIIILIALVLLAALAWVLWEFVISDSPAKTVKAVIAASRSGRTRKIKDNLTEESLNNPQMSERWLQMLTVALAKPDTHVAREDIGDDTARVWVTVMHGTGSGEQGRTDVAVQTVKIGGKWYVDLPGTMQGKSAQFWEAVEGEVRG